MNLSSIRPSAVLRAIEDGFIEVGHAVATVTKTTATFIREKRQEHRARAFERDALAAGIDVGKLRSKQKPNLFTRDTNGRFARVSA